MTVEKVKWLLLIIANVYGQISVQSAVQSAVPIGKGAGLDCNFDDLISVDCTLEAGFKVSLSKLDFELNPFS